MRLICSYCREDLGEREPLDHHGVSHVFCDACASHFERQWGGLRLGEYLDAFDAAVAAVNEDGRLVAANQRMADLLGKSQREVFGLLGGEAMECVYARLPEGCGGTTHCETCAIRRSVRAALETGRAQERVAAYLRRRPGPSLELSVSAYPEGDLVTLLIERATAAGPN